MNATATVVVTSSSSTVATTTTPTLDAATTGLNLTEPALDALGGPQGFIPLLVVTLVLFLGLGVLLILALLGCRCCSLKWIWSNRILRNTKSLGRAFMNEDNVELTEVRTDTGAARKRDVSGDDRDDKKKKNVKSLLDWDGTGRDD